MLTLLFRGFFFSLGLLGLAMIAGPILAAAGFFFVAGGILLFVGFGIDEGNKGESGEDRQSAEQVFHFNSRGGLK